MLGPITANEAKTIFCTDCEADDQRVLASSSPHTSRNIGANGLNGVTMWQTSDLLNESDVEQKFLYRFLTEEHPLGMGLPCSIIQTKANLRRFCVGKGAEAKLYYPDYVIVVLGLPLVVIEAKAPSESIEEGYRQARLYAHELNAL